MAPPSGELSSAARLRGPYSPGPLRQASSATGGAFVASVEDATCNINSKNNKQLKASTALRKAKYDASRLANCPGESDISVIQMKNPQLLLGAFIWIRQRPTLPGRLQPSTIGAERLNFCVRYGNRWIPFAVATGIVQGLYPENRTSSSQTSRSSYFLMVFGSSPRPISIIKLQTLLLFHR